MAVARFAGDTSAAPAVRRWLRERFPPGTLPLQVQQFLELLSTELVTNAVRHGRPPVDVSVEELPGPGHRLRVSVTDRGERLPVVRHVGLTATGGRGIALVDELSARWGTTPLAAGGGKVVWFELDWE